MGDLNDPLKDSYIGKVADALSSYIDELKEKGFDPTARIDRLAGAGKVIEGANKLRKAAEKAAADAVKHEQDLREQYYADATATISLVEGFLGKGHELVTKLRGLRADLIGDQSPNGSPAPAPAPVH